MPDSRRRSLAAQQPLTTAYWKGSLYTHAGLQILLHSGVFLIIRDTPIVLLTDMHVPKLTVVRQGEEARKLTLPAILVEVLTPQIAPCLS